MSWFDRITRAIGTSALFWGAVVTAVFYVVLDRAAEHLPPVVTQYAAGRWEAYACVAMFFVGVASLMVQLINVVMQTRWLGQPVFTGAIQEQAPSSARLLVKQLDALPPIRQQGYFAKRLRDGLQIVQQTGGQESLSDHLRRLAEADASRMQGGYGLVRFMAWAIPGVGCLGTVLGMATAITQLPTDPNEPLNVVKDAMGQAFETTALALGLAIVLMACKFLVEQREQRLLAGVDERVGQELLGRFGVASAAPSSQAEQFRQLSASISQMAQQMAEQQAILSKSAGQFNDGGGRSAGLGSDQIEAIVAKAVSKVLEAQPARAAASLGADAQFTGWSQVQIALQQIANFFARQQAEKAGEDKVALEITAALQEGSANWPVRKHMQLRGDGEGEALAGLWGSQT